MSDERNSDKRPPFQDKVRDIAARAAERFQAHSRLAEDHRINRTIEREVEKNASDRPATSSETPRLIDRPPSQREKDAARRHSFLATHSAEDARIRREIVEVEIIKEGLPVFGPEQWMVSSDAEKIVSLQSLVNRTKDIQGRQGLFKVEVARLETDSVRDDESRTITLNTQLLERGNSKPAVQALMKELHLVMQQHAIANPKAFRELDIENIQRWADRTQGKPNLSEEDARAYAARVTSRL